MNDLIWQFFSERVFYAGGMILYKEDYEIAVTKGSEEFLEGDFYKEFGEIFNTITTIIEIVRKFNLNDSPINNSLDSIYEILNYLHAAIIEPVGSEIFESTRSFIRDSVLSTIVMKIQVEHTSTGKEIFRKSVPNLDEIIPKIKNFVEWI